MVKGNDKHYHVSAISFSRVGEYALFRLLGNKKLILLLACLIVFIAIMGLTLGERKNITWPEKFVKDTVSFTQRLIL